MPLKYRAAQPLGIAHLKGRKRKGTLVLTVTLNPYFCACTAASHTQGCGGGVGGLGGAEYNRSTTGAMHINMICRPNYIQHFG